MKKRLIITAIVIVFIFLLANLIGFLRGRSEVAVSELTTGDCLSQFYVEETRRVVKPVVCSADHVQEVVGVDTQSLAEFSSLPSTSELEAAARTVCIPAFNEYTNLDYETAEFQITGIYPDAQAWDNNQRSIICLAANSDSSLIEGSLAAAVA